MPLAKKALQNADASQLRRELLTTGKIKMKIDDEIFVLDAEDVELLVEASEHYAAACDQQAVVVLNTNLTEELLEEGLYRDLLRRVQDLRKDLNIEYTDRVEISIVASEKVMRILEARRKHFMEETLCTTLNTTRSSLQKGNFRKIEIAGEIVAIVLSQT